VLANGSMSTNTASEGAIRRALVEADLVECMVALPPQLFYNTQIPAFLWFLNKAKPEHRRGQTLFIDARDMGTLVSRVRRELDEDDIAQIAGTFQDWQRAEGGYEDVPGFCKSAALDEIAGHGYVLTPGRYVGAAAAKDDGEPFDEKLARLTAELTAQFAESARLEEEIRRNLERLSYGL